MSGGPLAGLRVLEVGHILAGPYSTMLLADKLGIDILQSVFKTTALEMLPSRSPYPGGPLS